MKTLLMIRDQQLATDFVAALDMANPVVYAPMVSIEQIPHEHPLPVAETLIFTSSNAVRSYCQATADRTTKTLCVGSVTAYIAQNLGLNVQHTYDTVDALIADVKSSAPDYATILYPRGKVVSVDIAKALSDTQISVSQAILYKQAFHDLSPQAVAQIESSAVVVPVLSKEIAIRFLQAITRVKPHHLTIICISPTVAEIFNDTTGFAVKTATQPTRAALIDAVRTTLSS